ncbi:TIGR04283 family arsenosugar biosynthesis glycosyltransferase [Spirulina sp. CS-785/01]|uniref:TIGR04283 family arsenosugar biosynthesis glycosyltransferase n=1 Tax=Spirulina sp. CS-785/01 TaxID=3021716 RepID=UPI00232F91BC|nr:TIGR04283 family arsenosugar biosynthesis glycosyltransferase [Spirulina sp. CS-785/01]MDB9315044.1 TIGR04283 family arsenosugar biosynthesis glycosyltransferase [Spirulina sp. CS-785/01]
MSGLSVIIPVLNEASHIRNTLRSVQQYPEVEIIVVDGGSQDDTLAQVESLGISVIMSPQKGRAQQMNWGAKHATGEILLFLHGDTCLPPDYAPQVQAALQSPQVIAGAFTLGIDSDRWIFRWVEGMVNLRSQLCSLPYGDQALFLKKAIFQQFGGFPQLPLMEDFELVKQLRGRGKIAIVSQSVLTSSRRWQKLGVFKTTLINQLIILGYFFRISPDFLARWYRKMR